MAIPVEEFFKMPGYRPLYESMYYKARNMLLGTALFPLVFYHFPIAEASPLFSTASLTKWDWRRLPSYIVSYLATMGISYGYFNLILSKFAPAHIRESSPHTTQQLFTFLNQFENQWAVKLFTLTAAFVPLKSTPNMRLSNPGGITLEHVLIEDISSVMTARTLNLSRLFCREFLWKYIFTEHEVRYQGRRRQFFKGWVKRVIIDCTTPCLAYGLMKYAVPEIPWVKTVAPLITYRFVRAACMGVMSKVWDKLSPLLFEAPRKQTDEEEFNQANEYISEIGVVPAEFENTRGFIVNLLVNQNVPASMKLAMCETLWAMTAIETGYEKGFVDHGVLKWYQKEIQQYRKGSTDDADTDIIPEDPTNETNPISPLKRQITELGREATESIVCDNQCSICLAGLEPDQRCAKINSCGHRFHAICLVGWLMRNPNCPMCRTEFSTENKKKNPPCFFFPVWLKRFDIPHTYDYCEWDEIVTYAKVRELPVNPKVFKELEGDYINCKIGWLDFLIGIPLWAADLYPPDDIINFEVYGRDPQLWRMGVSTPDCPIYSGSS